MKQFFKMMLASFTGFVLAMILVFIFFFIIIASAISSGTEDKFSYENNSILELKLGSNIVERKVSNPFEKFSGGSQSSKQLSLQQIVSGIKEAKNDAKIKGILLRTDLYSGGLASSREIRNQLSDFKKSGKFIYAYGEVYTDAGYYIASVADKVYLNPKGLMEFNGFAGQIMFYKGMFDKMGVKFNVFKAGKYKSAVEPFIQSNMSDANKAQIKQYITELYGDFIKQIGESRKIDSGNLANIANGFLARNAAKSVEYKLIDELKYEDEVLQEIKTKLGVKEKEEINSLSFAKYTNHLSGHKYSSNKIAVVYAVGEINSGKNDAGDGIGSETMVEALRKARLDDNVKAVVLRVNSPGGSSLASDVIAREVSLIKKIKPVIVSFGDVAASGGYYISCLGDSIFAYPNSITGSIGVFALVPNISELYTQKLGLNYETVPTGEFSDLGRPDRDLTPAQKIFIQQSVNDIYKDFIGIVSMGRKIDTGKVASLAEGHVYTGIYAKEIGLIDGFGGLDRAIQSAAWKAKLKDYQIVDYPKLKSGFELFFGENMESKTEALLQTELGELYTPIKELKKVKAHSGIQMRMPWWIEVN